MYTIASNAGMEGALIVGKLLEQEDEDLGYDAATGMIVACMLKREINDGGCSCRIIGLPCLSLSRRICEHGEIRDH